MPGGDRSGPAGEGPKTGRAAGYCSGYDAPGYMNPIPGRGFGRGFGWGGGFRGAGRGGVPWGGGRGRAWGGGRGPGWGGGFGPARGYGRFGSAPPWYPEPYAAPITKEQEIEELKAQAAYFKDALEEIEKRVNELSASEGKKK